MIAHVAEASEASGRVLLWLEPDAIAMPQTANAAVAVAAAYAADIETLVLEAPSLSGVRDIPVAHLTLLGNATRQDADSIDVSERWSYLAAQQLRSVSAIAERARINISHTTARGDAVDRLADMCLERGPWNIIAVSRPPSQDLPELIGAILANVSGATGVVVAGRASAKLSDDVAVVLEDADRMPSMLRAAERLVPANGRIQVMVVADTHAEHGEIDGQARLLTADDPRYVHHRAGPSFGVAGAFDADLFRMKPSFVIARFGGALLGQARALTRLLSLATGPLLLVR